ncbi:hypothetical protein A2U01_0099220, partial [Trifolium medium]|nr:hypothetical protein [Trifolium medium]
VEVEVVDFAHFLPSLEILLHLFLILHLQVVQAPLVLRLPLLAHRLPIGSCGLLDFGIKLQSTRRGT